MNINEILDVCIRELLFGTAFLSDYKKELMLLYQEEKFLQIIDSISSSVSENVEFSIDPLLYEFKWFKLSKINDALNNERIMHCFPVYSNIIDSIIHRGKSGLSAAISVYYAIRYMMIKKSIKHEVDFVSDYDYRQKWPAKYRCDDGHYVRSKNEQLVDNWLYHNNLCHAYEVLIVDKKNGKEYINDFYIPQIKLYIEVWGYETPEYIKRKKQKISVYQENDLSLLQMTDREIKVLDDFLRRNILTLF